MDIRSNLRYIPTLIFLLAYAIAPAQTVRTHESVVLEYAEPATVDVSKERLKRVDAMCLEAIESGQIPGIVALISRRGKIVYHKAFGTADASGRRLQYNDIFRLASQTKAITATGVMMLWEEGKFRLDDPVSMYIPEFKDPHVLDSVLPDGTIVSSPAENEITIRHLLTHTSGLGYGVIDGDDRFKKMYKDSGIIDLFTTEDISIGENVKKLARLPLHHEPGEAFTYGESYDVLGYFIEVISGMPFDRFLKERLFDPLQMDDTWFYLPDSKADRLVHVQTHESGQWVNYPTTFYDPDYPIKGAKRFFSGGAGLSSTATDYAKFLQMYLNHGEYDGHRILSPSTVRVIMANQIGDLWGENPGMFYGLAFGVISETGEGKGERGSEGTFSWGGYFNTSYFADPKEQVIGIILKQTQKIDRDDTGWKFPILVSQCVD